MPQFIPIETLFESTFWNIGALSAILELNEYVEPLFFWQVENSPSCGELWFLDFSETWLLVPERTN